VFNGFATLLTSLCSYFNPDIKIMPEKGKTFIVDSLIIDKIKKTDGVAALSITLDEIAFFDYNGRQDFGRIKGVDASFKTVTSIDTTLREGDYKLMQDNKPYVVVGAGLRNNLAIDIENLFLPIDVYVPRMNNSGLPMSQFRKGIAYPAGTFAIQQEFDNEYIIADLEYTQSLMGLEHKASAYEVKLSPDANISRLKQALSSILGKEYNIQDKYEQNASFLRLMNIEKWISLAILSLMLLLIAFNLIGAIWMIVLDKRADIAILKSMGMTNGDVRKIFLYEGFLLSALGFGVGLFLAVVLYVAQKQFGLVSIPQGFVVSSYPIEMKVFDVLIVAVIVFIIGFLASLLPASRATLTPPIFREE